MISYIYFVDYAFYYAYKMWVLFFYFYIRYVGNSFIWKTHQGNHIFSIENYYFFLVFNRGICMNFTL